MAKLHLLRDYGTVQVASAHPVLVGEERGWKWNGSEDSPTFSPSLLVHDTTTSGRCHSFVRESMIEFLSDCYHEYAGHTISIPEWKE